MIVLRRTGSSGEWFSYTPGFLIPQLRIPKRSNEGTVSFYHFTSAGIRIFIKNLLDNRTNEYLSVSNKPFGSFS